MNKSRLEAFSDGVIAIIITIMVLGIQVPEGAEWVDLKRLVHKFISYLLSFIYVGIYWNNHHHLLQSVKSVNSKVMWTNLNFLFWLSLMPFASGWLGEHEFATKPTIFYGVILLANALAYHG